MKVKVNKEACIGCGACAAICEALFKLNDEGLSEVVREDVKEEEKQDVLDASESCPTAAIIVEGE